MVKYYNKDTQKMLTLHNFQFIKPYIEKIDDLVENNKINSDCKQTRGVKLDYKCLDNPFSDSENEDPSMIIIQLMINNESYHLATNDRLISLKEAKKSPDWPEWEKAIESKLEQLWDMGTWKLVKRPINMIPITNKWLFI